MRGYFGIGVEGISKPFNVGNLFRSAHALGASFVFTVNAQYERRDLAQTDTSDSLGQMPFYEFPDVASLTLPKGCALVGVELIPDANELPSFCHPPRAAYILGPENGSLSKATLDKCDYTLKIPTKFCLNVGIAGVLVMYDRMMAYGKFAPRPMHVSGNIPHLKDGVDVMGNFRSPPPLAEVALSIEKSSS